MSEHPFLRFINLVSFDQKLHSLENEKMHVDHEMAALRKQESDFLRDIEDMHNHVLQLKKRVDEQELEMHVLDQKEKDKKKHLENLADYKDYQLIKLEIAHVQRLQFDQEKNVMQAWSQLENRLNNL